MKIHAIHLYKHNSEVSLASVYAGELFVRLIIGLFKISAQLNTFLITCLYAYIHSNWLRKF